MATMPRSKKVNSIPSCSPSVLTYDSGTKNVKLNMLLATSLDARLFIVIADGLLLAKLPSHRP